MRTLRPPHRPLVRWAAIFYGAMTLGTLAVSLALGRGWPVGTMPDSAGSVMQAVVMGYVTGLAIVLLSRWMESRFVWAQRLSQGFARTLGPLRDRDVFALASLSSIAEELLFRGLLLGALGYVGSSLLFGLVHFVPERTWIPWTLLAIGAGFVFGGLALVSGSVLAPVVAHFVVNLLNLRSLATRPPYPPDGRPDL